MCLSWLTWVPVTAPPSPPPPTTWVSSHRRLSAVTVTSGANLFLPHCSWRLNIIKLVSFLFCHLRTTFFLFLLLLRAPHRLRHNWSLRSRSEASTAALSGSRRKCESPAVQVEVIAESLSFLLYSVPHLSSGLWLKLPSPSLMVSFSWSGPGHCLPSSTLEQHCHIYRHGEIENHTVFSFCIQIQQHISLRRYSLCFLAGGLQHFPNIPKLTFKHWSSHPFVLLGSRKL